MESYSRERERFCSLDFLGEEPGDKLDREIMRVCGALRLRVTELAFFPFALRRTVAAFCNTTPFFVFGLSHESCHEMDFAHSLLYIVSP